jgi:hypothetical protein
MLFYHILAILNMDSQMVKKVYLIIVCLFLEMLLIWDA